MGHIKYFFIGLFIISLCIGIVVGTIYFFSVFPKSKEWALGAVILLFIIIGSYKLGKAVFE